MTTCFVETAGIVNNGSCTNPFSKRSPEEDCLWSCGTEDGAVLNRNNVKTNKTNKNKNKEKGINISKYTQF